MKRSSIADKLVNSPNCGKNYDKTKFMILRKCADLLNSIRLKAILIHLYKPKLSKHNFPYLINLFCCS